MTNSQAVSAVSSFPIWKTVRLGRHKSAPIYCWVMTAIPYRFGYCASDILGQAGFTCAADEPDVDLVALSGDELGFKEVAEYGNVCARALQLGLELCPAEVGPILRLDYMDQPLKMLRLIAMKPITNAAGVPSIFGLENDGLNLRLDGCRAYPDDSWGSDPRFVFVRPK